MTINDEPDVSSISRRRAANLVRSLVIFSCLHASAPAGADIRFAEATRIAGMTHTGTSYGAAWGDFNSDGWPDLWVGNHDSKPTLYLNNRDGSFTDIIDSIWEAYPNADTHGAAWADFDNDGDQDLVELVSAQRKIDGGFVPWAGKNHLFVNENGKLTEKAEQFGLAKPGQASTPLWVDADRDGKLDLLVVNTRQRGQPNSTLFRQVAGRFEPANKKLGFRDDRWSRRDELFGRLRNALRFSFGAINLLNTRHLLEHAQLANLIGDHELELALFSGPTRVFSITKSSAQEVTAAIGFPQLETIPGQSTISDVAVADFDGDGHPDMYLTRGAFLPSGLTQPRPNQIKTRLTTWYRGRKDPLAVSFRTDGDLTIQTYPPWLSLSQVFIGASGRHPGARSFRVSAKDAEVRPANAADTKRPEGIHITFDPDSKTWMLEISSAGGFVDAIVDSTKRITDLKAHGFEPDQDKGVDALLFRRGDKFEPRPLPTEIAEGTSCHSVTAGDFDNDMDIDLYLVCTGPVVNRPNLLLENDGQGNFHIVPNAGGGAGSVFGRGDAVAVADYNRDGSLDLFVTNGADPTSPFVQDGPHQLFRNLGNDNRWIEIDLEGTRSNRDGIGAIVSLEAGGIKQVRGQNGGIHRIVQNHQRLHFGLGKNSVIDRLTVRWPSGIVQEITDVPSNQILRIREQSEQ